MAKTEKHVFHIFERARWVEAQARGEYTPESYGKEGFIHLSTKHQLKGTAEKYYRGQTGLGVLEIEIGRLKAPLKYENLSGGKDLFPHLYGALNTDAVTRVMLLGLSRDGEFLWPDDLS